MQGRTATIVGAMVMCAAARAHGGAAVYPQGVFARFAEEKAVVVWDGAKKTEHVLRSFTLKGDADSFGVLMATPTIPTVSRETDEVIERVEHVLAPKAQPGHVAPQEPDVLKRTQVGDVEAVTLKAADEHALGDWLARNRFIDKPALRAWEKAYVDKGWVITALRCTAKGTGDRKLEVPTMRLSFKTDAPSFSYAEATADTVDEAAYRAKYSTQPSQFRGYNYGYGTRPFDVYVVAERQLQTVVGQTTGGPPVADAMRVTADTLETALGDTKAWGFDAKSRPTWVVTHLSENVWQRSTQSDLGFAPYDLPKPRPGVGITEADDRPVGPTFPGSSMAWMSDPSATQGSPPASPHKKLFRYGAIALFFLVAGVAAYAVLGEQERKSKPKS